MDEEKISHNLQEQTQCPSCGGNLIYKPGTQVLQCEHCGTEVEIEFQAVAIEENDFASALEQYSSGVEKEAIHVTQCHSCGAKVTLEKNIVSDRCPFCSSILVIKSDEFLTRIKPKSLLPFKIDKNKAFELYKNWINRLWFAPNDLKRNAKQVDSLLGIYIPYWTYDSDTYTQFRGERGDNYYVTETYTTFENGKPVTRTRTVTRIRWTPVAGEFSLFFDDILVLASRSLPKDHTDALEPWDLENLVPIDERFLSGYRTEVYQVDLQEGFSQAKSIIDRSIDDEIRRRIGGDHQRIHAKSTHYQNVTFKHILLPAYVSAYKYGKKIYRFLVNARTGEVQGERPYSILKIALAVLFGIAVLVGIWFWFQSTQSAHQ